MASAHGASNKDTLRPLPDDIHFVKVPVGHGHEAATLVLGGHFGDLCAAKRAVDGRDLVIKVYHVLTPYASQLASLLSSVSKIPAHSRLINVIGICMNPTRTAHCLLMVVRERADIALSEDIARDPAIRTVVLKDVQTALLFLHAEGIAHGRLRLSQVLLQTERFFVLASLGLE